MQPWTRGARDQRGRDRHGAGPTADGAGRSYRQALEGRVGPSDWRIPPMTHAGQAAQTAPLTRPTNPRAAGETFGGAR